MTSKLPETEEQDQETVQDLQQGNQEGLCHDKNELQQDENVTEQDTDISGESDNSLPQQDSSMTEEVQCTQREPDQEVDNIGTNEQPEDLSHAEEEQNKGEGSGDTQEENVKVEEAMSSPVSATKRMFVAGFLAVVLAVLWQLEVPDEVLLLVDKSVVLSMNQQELFNHVSNLETLPQVRLCL